MPIDPSDPIVELVDAEDGTFRVTQQSGQVLGPFPAERRPQLDRIRQLNTGRTPGTPLAHSDIPAAPPMPQTSQPVPTQPPAPVPAAPPPQAPIPQAPTPSTSFAPGLGTAGASDTIKSGRVTTGFDEPSRSEVAQSGEQRDVATMQAGAATAATQAAIDADQDAKTRIAMINTQQEFARKQEQQAAGQKHYDEAMQDYDREVNRKIDPSQALGGSNLALAFGVGIAQAFANAFSAKAGQKGTLDLVGDIIRRNLDEQRRKRQLVLGDSKSATIAIAREMQNRENDLTELAARHLELQGATGTGVDLIRRAKRTEYALGLRLQNKERFHKDTLNMATKVQQSVAETQALQAAAPKPVGEGIPKTELQRELKRYDWDNPKDTAQYQKLNAEYQPMALAHKRGREMIKFFKDASDGNDVPGFGRMASLLAREAVSAEAKSLRTKLGIKMAQFMNEISGAAVSPEERARLNDLVIGTGRLPEIVTGLEELMAKNSDRVARFREGPNHEMIRSIDGFVARGSTRSASATGHKQEQLDALEKANAPAKTAAAVAKAESDAVRAKTQEKRAAARAKKDAPSRLARVTLDELGPVRDGESKKVKKMRAAAAKVIDKQQQRETQEELRSRGGTRPGGGRF